MPALLEMDVVPDLCSILSMPRAAAAVAVPSEVKAPDERRDECIAGSCFFCGDALGETMAALEVVDLLFLAVRGDRRRFLEAEAGDGVLAAARC
jgi:hypothetical protein